MTEQEIREELLQRYHDVAVVYWVYRKVRDPKIGLTQRLIHALDDVTALRKYIVEKEAEGRNLYVYRVGRTRTDPTMQIESHLVYKTNELWHEELSI